MDQRQRNARAVVAGREDFLGLHARGVDARGRRQVGAVRAAGGRIVEHVFGRTQPAAHADQRARRLDVGGRVERVAFEGHRHDMALLAVERHCAHPRDGAVALARVDAVLGQRELGQHGMAFGDHDRRVRQVGMRERRGQQPEARGVLLRQHEQRLPVQRELRRAVADVGDLLPRRAAVVDLGQRRDVDGGRGVVHVVVGDCDHVGRVRRGQDVGGLAFRHVQARLHAAAEHDDVAFAIGMRADVVDVGARVVFALGRRRVRADLVVAQIVEGLVVRTPADHVVGGAGYGLAVRLAGGDVHHVQHALLRAAGRHAVRQQLAVVRRFVEVERVVGRGAFAQLARVDQQVLLAGEAVAVVELGQLRRRLRHFVEIAVAAALEAAAAQVGVEQRVDAFLQRGAAGDRVEPDARVVGLGLHPGLHVGVAEIFHVAVVVDDGGAEVVGRHRPHRRDGLALRAGEGRRDETEDECRAGTQCSREGGNAHGPGLLMDECRQSRGVPIRTSLQALEADRGKPLASRFARGFIPIEDERSTYTELSRSGLIMNPSQVQNRPHIGRNPGNPSPSTRTPSS